MTDPVSDELQRGAAESLPWRPALALAIGLHLVTALALVFGPTRSSRPLMLPSVQVRIGSLPPTRSAAGAASPTGASANSKPMGHPAPPALAAAANHSQRHAAHKELKPSAKSVEASSTAARASSEAPAADATMSRGQPGTTARAANGVTNAASPGGGIAVGPGENGAGTGDFPYDYYLSRVLASIETNWFKPPSAAGTRCRVICRIDRSGRLLEAGLAEPSAQPAFDRAALRAVYAAAPFPPLPQGYASGSLTLHLEFGP